MILFYIKAFFRAVTNNVFKIIGLVFLFSVLQIVILRFSSFTVSDSNSYRDNNFKVFGLNIPRNLDFCSEKIPVNDYALKDNLEQEFFSNKYWKRNYMFLFGKAQKWFPYIEPILKQEGIPDDFKYLAVIESHLSNAVSPMGAVGFWQLLPATARKYGLRVNEFVDERMDVEKSTRAACKLIKDAYKVFNNWTLCAAAYNLGITGIQNALNAQQTDNYYDLLLNKETGSFVYRILAYKTLFSNPEHFGIKQKTIKFYSKIPVKIVKIDSSITNFNHFSKAVSCNKALIKLFNPWILQEVLPNPDKQIFEFKIPKKTNADYSSYFDDLLEKKSSETETTDTYQKQDSASKYVITHLITDKETLKEISEFYDVNEKDLMQWNNLHDTVVLKAGKILIIKLNLNPKSEK